MERNVAIIVTDTLRFDYAKKYIDTSLSKLGLKLVEGYSTSPWTLPSHVSLFTGAVPSHHKIFEKFTKGIGNFYVPFWEYNSLVKYFRILDYSVAWFTANRLLTPYFGFQGFDLFYNVFSSKEALLGSWVPEDLKQLSRIKKIRKCLHEKRFKDLAFLALASISRRVLRFFLYWPEKGILYLLKNIDSLTGLERPIFLFINVMEAHEPYYRTFFKWGEILRYKTEGYPPKHIEKWRSGYRKACMYLGEKLPLLIKKVKKLLGKNTILVVLADHGQQLGEFKNYLGHELWLTEELIKVPVWSNINLPRRVWLPEIPWYVLNTLGWEKYKRERDILFFSESYGLSSTSVKALDQWRIRVTDPKTGEYVIYNASEAEVELKNVRCKEKEETLLKGIRQFVEQPEQASLALEL